MKNKEESVVNLFNKRIAQSKLKPTTKPNLGYEWVWNNGAQEWEQVMKQGEFQRIVEPGLGKPGEVKTTSEQPYLRYSMEKNAVVPAWILALATAAVTPALVNLFFKLTGAPKIAIEAALIDGDYDRAYNLVGNFWGTPLEKLGALKNIAYHAFYQDLNTNINFQQWASSKFPELEASGYSTPETIPGTSITKPV